METVLSRSPLWQNTHFVECKSSSEIIVGQDGQPLCQELEISLCAPRGKLEYTSNHTGHPSSLTLMAFHPGWDDYVDLTETVAEMSQHLIDQDGQLEGAMPEGGALPKEKDTAKIVALPPNDDIKLMSASEFPGSQYGLSTQDNPINLSDAPTEVLNTATCPEGTEPIDESALLGHFSNTLSEMAESLLDLEDGFFKALREGIIETERALWDISHIDAHYVSQVVTTMASWQEVVQTAITYMENVDLTTYLTRQENM